MGGNNVKFEENYSCTKLKLCHNMHVHVCAFSYADAITNRKDYDQLKVIMARIRS